MTHLGTLKIKEEKMLSVEDSIAGGCMLMHGDPLPCFHVTFHFSLAYSYKPV